jgi:ankyrin repeat protein
VGLISHDDRLSYRVLRRFQWVFSQLEALRHTVQPDVQGILNKLPRTLDETYERVLKNINENNQKHARRLLQCLAVAVRPLRIEELAEILAFDFDVDQGGIPKFHADRRPKDQEGALLSTCSSLIAVVENRGSWTVQFSHLSVKEFLTSTRLASSTGELSPYHILPNAAHTTLAQACLGLLLHLEDPSDANSVKSSPLAMYAARYWVVHAQFEDVASRVEDGMKSLFNSDKPHFSAWIGLYDKDTKYEKKLPSEIPSPLYYSALCGFHDLVRYLAVKHPHHVNAVGGSCGLPLVAALCRSHFKVAELLLEHGGTVDVRDTEEQTPLHKVMARHDKTDIDAVQFLLEHGADVNSRRDDLWTPLHLAVTVGGLTMARILLEHRADANSRNKDGQTPLHLLSKWTTSQDEDDSPDLAKSLLEYGANMDEKDNDSAAPLHLASYHGKLQMAQLLLDHGAQANAKTDSGETPLHRVSFGTFKSQQDGVRLVELLLGRGAEVDVQRKDNWTPLHVASYYGKLEIVRLLLNQGAKVNAETDGGETPLHRVTHGKYESQEDCARAARLLLERGGDANAQRKDHSTPLHLASHLEKLEIARLLLDHGAKVDMETIKKTPCTYWRAAHTKPRMVSVLHDYYWSAAQM